MRRQWLIVAALAAATLVFAIGLSAALWGRPAWLLTPWQRGLAPAAREASELHDLREQMAQLGAENTLLRTRLDQYAAIQGEGGFLPERVVVARGRVVSRTARTGRRYFELDVGTGNGVARDLPVTAGWSLAGLVTGVREGRCLVQELSDSECRVPATVLDGKKTLAEGVLSGTGETGWARLDFIESRDGLRIDPGMTVITAGSDGRLQPGLLIGHIDEAQRGTGAEHWHIRVRLAADASALESLLVLKIPATVPGPVETTGTLDEP